MAEFIEYELEDGTTLKVFAPPGAEIREAKVGETFRSGVRGFSAKEEESGKKKFTDALATVKQASGELMGQLKELQADEVEVEFGLTTTGTAGNFAIGSVGVSANYVVKLKWTNKNKAE